jgi:hypothetical protein
MRFARFGVGGFKGCFDVGIVVESDNNPANQPSNNPTNQASNNPTNQSDSFLNI